ncbi:hypothetical protein [Corynebacterium kozikiae]|uniref:hypothetical protein n=1 Tax=Corynebacterium kozikiae TaxID=2968469 RepID=UPI00211D002B|nr:hypothetical protein [Corynebacterium sp. 76QC2CO]MCQ9344114.1 hypothetical protein [Corynebacterium sp. 76QC2CO]
MDNDDLWHLVWAELSSKSITAMSSFSALPRRMEFEQEQQEQQEQGMSLILQRLDGERSSHFTHFFQALNLALTQKFSNS